MAGTFYDLDLTGARTGSVAADAGETLDRVLTASVSDAAVDAERDGFLLCIRRIRARRIGRPSRREVEAAISGRASKARRWSAVDDEAAVERNQDFMGCWT